MDTGANQNQPGWVFKPEDAAKPQPAAPVTNPVPPASTIPEIVPAAAPAADPAPAAVGPSASGTRPQEVPFSPVEAVTSAANGVTPDSDYSLRWTASEYVSRQKGGSWFLGLGVGSILLSAFIYLVTRDVLSVVFVMLLVVAVGIYGARVPKSREYGIGDHGILIGAKFYPYTLFKSFAVMQEDAIGYISLMPTQRFMPQMAMYYAPDDEDRIVETLGTYLPYEEREHDLIDRLSHRVRF